MPLAIFIVVIMGFFVATLSRTTIQSAISTSQEGVSLQAFYAAESGAQLGMNNLFYDPANELAQVDVDSRCNTMNLLPVFSVTGLDNCSARVSCALDNSVPGSRFYTITSDGECGAGDVRSSRTVLVSARME